MDNKHVLEVVADRSTKDSIVMRYKDMLKHFEETRRNVRLRRLAGQVSDILSKIKAATDLPKKEMLPIAKRKSDSKNVLFMLLNKLDQIDFNLT